MSVDGGSWEDDTLVSEEDTLEASSRQEHEDEQLAASPESDSVPSFLGTGLEVGIRSA